MHVHVGYVRRNLHVRVECSLPQISAIILHRTIRQIGRVEDRRSSLGHLATLRFGSNFALLYVLIEFSGWRMSIGIAQI